MEIQRTAIIGLGALGVMYGERIAGQLGRDAVRIIADRQRIDRYKKDGVYCNGARCDFQYIDAGADNQEPADLVIFSVKFNGLAAAMAAAARQIGPQTLIISVLNGIVSEDILAETFGVDKVLYAVGQGMDAVKVGNQLQYDHIGWLSIGSPDAAAQEKVDRLARFFDRAGLPYDRPDDILRHMWSKLMLNTGINQTIAVYEANYGAVQREGEARQTMIAAMREVIAVARCRGIALGESDIEHWLHVIPTMNPESMPSMRQDTLAGRPTEVDLFAGTIIKLGDEYGIPTPVNHFLYTRIRDIEQGRKPQLQRE
ncbi:MAG: ketopantoate reductase family protein [Sporolactobacillus sp.]